MAGSNASPMLGDVGGDVKRGSIEAAVFRVAIPVDSGEQASPHCYMEGHAVPPKQRKNSMMNIERTELGLWLLVPETKQKEVKKEVKPRKVKAVKSVTYVKQVIKALGL